ncbi:MAG: AIR synthase-related protein [Candidatus Aenigmarchaeota archaeon]|nr:AIR synthase-related protein [Candidatus Aenigmarchaeota archaeon]
MVKNQLEITLKSTLPDPEGEKVKRKVKEYFNLKVEKVRIIDVKTVESEKLKGDDLEALRIKIFTNPVTQISSINDPLANNLDWNYAVWVGYKPGVMDPAGHTAVEAIKDMLKTGFGKDEAVYTSKIYLFKGDLTKPDGYRIAEEMLGNDIIQRWKVISKDEWKKSGFEVPSPRVILDYEPSVNTFSIGSDEELARLSKERNLALNPKDIPTIREYFLRSEIQKERAEFGLFEPTDIELEYIAQARSDHCNHNTFNGKFYYKDLSTGEEIVIENLFEECIKNPTLKLKDKKDWVLSVLWDNAGIAKFDENYNYSISAETHNSPSNIEPYGGAITGNVGEFRDKLGAGKGSKIVLGLYGFGVGPRDYDGDLKPRLHPRRLLDGVIEGIRDGANKSGVPTPFGNVFFHPGYLGKCNIFVGSVGIMPAKINDKPTYEKHINDGDLCIMVGGRVGKDGIHGATAASEEYSEHTPAGHVQIGFPYGQKKMEGLILEARDKDLIEFITDNGGGGLSSSVGESCRYCGKYGGVEVDLERVPLKYPGLNPWEIWISESQERMTLAISPENHDEFMSLAKKHDVEATVIGTYKDTGKIHIRYKGKPIMHVDLNLLKSNFPQWEFEAEWIPPELRGLTEPVLKEPEDYNSVLEDMLSRPNVCSKEWVARQYDHEVQGGSVIKPMVGVDRDVHSDAVVIKPILESQKGFAVTQVVNPFFSEIDTYHMTAYVIDEAVRRLIAIGGNLDHIGGVDNFCWPNIQYDPETNPDGKYKAAQLVRSNLALKKYCELFGIPLLSGKDSMYIDGNLKGKYGEIHKVSGPPTIQFTANSVIDDVSKCITMDAKMPGDLVYVLGETKDELGGSEYYDMLGYTGLNIPKVDIDKSLPMYRALQKAIEEEIVASAHAVSRGGLGVHLSEVAFAGNLGMDVDLSKVPTKLKRNDKILYSESAGRVIVTIAPEYKERFEELLSNYPYGQIGYVNDTNEFKIKGIDGREIINKSIHDLKQAYKKTFGDLI